MRYAFIKQHEQEYSVRRMCKVMQVHASGYYAWKPLLGVQVAGWGIKKMKTKWGSCNVQARRIWLNLELAKTPVQCLEYIVVHELVHLIERHHNERFTALMGQHMPDWPQRRQLLNGLPLGHEQWSY